MRCLLKYSNTETYYLVIADENGLQISREEFQIDIAFMEAVVSIGVRNGSHINWIGTGFL